MSRFAKITHGITISLLAVVVLGVTAVGFAQSWAGLYAWAVEHGLTGWKAMSFPAMVDLFIAVGELSLFALTLEGHRLTRRALSWFDLLVPAAVALVGWVVSLAFNVGHVHGGLEAKVTAAVAPIASCVGLLLLLRTLHRFVTRQADQPVREPGGEDVPEAPEGDVFDHPDHEVVEGDRAGQGAIVDLRTAVLAAKAAGTSQRTISREFGIPRYRVRKLLELPEGDQELVTT